MTRSQATEAVRNATRNHWPGAKLPKFVSDVVPFQPLSPTEMGMVAQLELEKYRDGAFSRARSCPATPFQYNQAVHLDWYQWMTCFTAVRVLAVFNAVPQS